jgi:EAL and modified HD-GYP domain-containing signal transduction protein
MQPSVDCPFSYQPVLDREGRIYAYSVLYKKVDPGAGNEDDAVMTERFAVNAFLTPEALDRLGARKVFVQADASFLESGMVSMLPANNTVLELTDIQGLTQGCRDLCAGYRRMGYTFALGHLSLLPETSGLLDIVDIVKLDIASLSQKDLMHAVDVLKGQSVKLLAENVASPEAFERCKALGFDFYQGYYFARPGGAVDAVPEPRRTKVLVLLAMFENDAGDKDIERALKLSPELTMHLLWLANSAAFGMRGRVGSVRELLNMFGRSKLANWLQVLLYISGGSERGLALFELAVRRGRLIESLVQDLTHQRGSSRQEKGFMVGMLSLVDVLLNAPITEILPRIGVDEEIRDAILTRYGVLGRMLNICEALEAADFDALSELAAACGIREARVMEAQREAMLWAGAVADEVAASAMERQ